VYPAADVDVVYVGTPHSSGGDRAWKDVLYEKPCVSNAKGIGKVIKAAKGRRV